MSNYNLISKELQERMAKDRKKHVVNPYAFKDEDIVREYKNDEANIWRPAFVRDVEKILHNPYYLRYADKTQVFSFVKNDDISRRAYHVQLVSRIARNIGRNLNLNEDLIEAISLGHDIGHTPFGHAGERILNKLYNAETGRYFNHNIQSARVFMTLFPVNLSLQTLDGIICHNGELELKEYRPAKYNDFDTLKRKIEDACIDRNSIEKLIPCTLEGCVMRVSDIIAYIGKDRQDAEKLGVINPIDNCFNKSNIGNKNAEIINNMIVNIVENSYGKDHLSMDDEYFEAFKKAKKENTEIIYKQDIVNKNFNDIIAGMMEKMYKKFLNDLKEENNSSLIMTHHVNYLDRYNNFDKGFYKNRVRYMDEEINNIVTDYIASMTDDYFIDAYDYMFPEEKKTISYRGYFE